jgi:predicted acyltransferase
MQAPPQRVLSVDVLRGLTIALMILVNDPGDWSHVYSQLDHAPWNGFTLTDFVFPNFLFIVGVSTVFSISSRMAKGDCRLTLAGHLFRRAFTIFAIKMCLSAYPHFHLTHLRIFGVLTRIAICYLIAGLICLAVWNTRRRALILATITAALLVGYWALMRFVPVPGLGLASRWDAIPTHAIPILDPVNNLAAWLDRGFNAFTRTWLHTGALYNKTHDPEGLLSTIPATATTLIGCLAGLLLRRVPHDHREEPIVGPVSTEPAVPAKAPSSSWVDSASAVSSMHCLRMLVLSGLISLTLGLLWSPFFPINKNLWTSSYVLFSAGLSLLLLALCYWLIDIRRLNEKPYGKALLWPWLVFGSNAITAFVMSNLLVQTASWIKAPAGAWVSPANPAKHISAWQWTYIHLFARHGSTYATSVAFAVAFTALCFLPNLFLWRRKIFLKV